MGICNSEPKKAKITCEVSSQNEESEKAMLGKLKESLNVKGVEVQWDEIVVNPQLLYMKIIYSRGSNVMTLASGVNEVTKGDLDKIADEIAKKYRESKND